MKPLFKTGLRRHPNGGFSLIELLVAVTVLALVVVPLLHTFVTAAATSARSRQLGDATLASQNVAESIEAYDLATLLRSPGTVLGGSGGYYTFDGAGYTRIDRLPEATETYYLGAGAIAAGASQFNAMVTLSADAGAAANANPITEYSRMDAVFTQSKQQAEDPDKISYENFQTHAASLGGDWEAPESVTRTIELKVWETDGKMEATLTFYYSYTFTYHRPVIGIDGLPTTEDVSVSWEDSAPPTYMLFTKPYDMAVGTPSIYLMYFPLYGTNKIDQIVIENTQDLIFNLFLVKQVDESLGDDLDAKELLYSPTVTLRLSSGCGRTEASWPKVYSNVKENLVTGNPIPGRYKVQFGRGASLNGAFVNEGALVSQATRNRLYQVTIDIYPPDAADFSGRKLCSFQTTKLQ